MLVVLRVHLELQYFRQQI